MGGLKKYMPITFFTMMAGWLAICGIVPFAGFFSKDEILWRTGAQPQREYRAAPPGFSGPLGF